MSSSTAMNSPSPQTMHLTIQSTLSHPLGGTCELELPPSTTLKEVISEFCNERGVNSIPPSLCLCNLSNEPLPLTSTLSRQGIEDKDVLFLTNIKEADVPSSAVRWLQIGAGAIAIGLCGIVIITVLLVTTSTLIPIEYGIVIDAGSSHTAFAIYKWNGPKYFGTGCVKQVGDACNIEDGLQDAEDPTTAGKQLIPCINNSMVTIPTNKQASTSLFLGATAGMRILEMANPLVAKVLMLSAKFTLSTRSDYQIKSVRILTGEEEAVSAWITANFLKDVIPSSSPKTSSFGALDMGGASTQLTFAKSSDDPTKYSSDTVHLRLYGQDFFVEAKSYLCFGNNQAHRRYLAYLAYTKGLDNDAPIIDPCLPKGYSKTYNAEYLFYHPCTLCTKWKKKNVPPTKNFTFEGQSNSDACKDIVINTFDDQNCINAGCSACYTTHPVDTSLSFLAFATYTYAYKFLNVTNNTLEAFIDASESYCNKKWSEVKDMPAPPKFLIMYCFDAWYIYTALILKYGFNDTTWANIHFTSKINSVEVGWSLGYMINQTNAIPTEKPIVDRLIDSGTYVVLCFLLGLVFFVGVIHLLYWYKNRGQSSRQRHSSTYHDPNSPS